MLPNYSKILKEDDGNDSHETLLPSEGFLVPIRTTQKISLRALLLHALLVLLYTSIYVTIWHLQINNTLVYSPAATAVSYTRKYIDLDSPNEYTGNPSPKLDAVWDGLLQGYNLRIPAYLLNEDEKQENSIILADGSGDYWGVSYAHHTLHCLKSIRHYLAGPEYYPQHHVYDPEEGHVIPPHIDHCIESLRQYILCKPDISILLAFWPSSPSEGNWEDRRPRPTANASTTHTCINWDLVQNWARNNEFVVSEETVRHPVFGYPY